MTISFSNFSKDKKMKQPMGQTNKFVISLLILMVLSNCNAGMVKKDQAIAETTQITEKQYVPESYISFLPRELSENSGLVEYNNLLWTFNDSGGQNIIYGFNSLGEIVRQISIYNARNRDWEDIAQDDNFFYIGDFGNNNGIRKDLTVYKINKSEIGSGPATEISAETIEFRFANQHGFHFLPQTTEFDCEALAERKGRLYVFTKDWKYENTKVYQLPKEKGNYTLHPADSFQVKGLITGADFSSDQSKLALVGYRNFKPIVRLFYNVSEDNIFGSKSDFIALDSIAGAQTEGICFIGNDTLLVSCESTNHYPAQVFIIDLNTLK